MYCRSNFAATPDRSTDGDGTISLPRLPRIAPPTGTEDGARGTFSPLGGGGRIGGSMLQPCQTAPAAVPPVSRFPASPVRVLRIDLLPQKNRRRYLHPTNYSAKSSKGTLHGVFAPQNRSQVPLPDFLLRHNARRAICWTFCFAKSIAGTFHGFLAPQKASATRSIGLLAPKNRTKVRSPRLLTVFYTSSLVPLPSHLLTPRSYGR